MRHAAAEFDRDQLALGARECIVRACKLERDGDVLQRRHGGNEVEGLENDADMLAAKARQLVLVELAEVLAGDHHRTDVGAFQPGHHHQERRFARSRRTQECDGFAAPYIEADVSQDVNAGGAAAERQVDAAQRNGRAAERMPQRVMHVSG